MKATAVLVSPSLETKTAWAAALGPAFEVRLAASALEGATLVDLNAVVVADLRGLGLEECMRLLDALLPGAVGIVCGGEAVAEADQTALLSAGALDVIVGPVSPRALAARIAALLRTRLPRALRAKFVEDAGLGLVGQLSRGIIHELGNPLAFVLANLRTLREYRDEIVETLGASAAGGPLATVLEDLGPLLDESLEGAARIDALLQLLRSFVRPDSGAASSIDVRESVEAALVLLRHELRGVAVEAQLAPGIRVAGSDTGIRHLLAHLIFAATRMLAAGRPRRLELRVATAETTARLQFCAEPVDAALAGETWGAYCGQGSLDGDASSLSLAAARTILREHSGTIHVDLAGEALRFEVELPL